MTEDQREQTDPQPTEDRRTDVQSKTDQSKGDRPMNVLDRSPNYWQRELEGRLRRYLIDVPAEKIIERYADVHEGHREQAGIELPMSVWWAAKQAYHEQVAGEAEGR